MTKTVTEIFKEFRKQIEAICKVKLIFPDEKK